MTIRSLHLLFVERPGRARRLRRYLRARRLRVVDAPRGTIDSTSLEIWGARMRQCLPLIDMRRFFALLSAALEQ